MLDYEQFLQRLHDTLTSLRWEQNHSWVLQFKQPEWMQLKKLQLVTCNFNLHSFQIRIPSNHVWWSVFILMPATFLWFKTINKLFFFASTAPQPCPPGYYSNMGWIQCLPCKRGFRCKEGATTDSPPEGKKLCQYNKFTFIFCLSVILKWHHNMIIHVLFNETCSLCLGFSDAKFSRGITLQEPNNGCEGDYRKTARYKIDVNSFFLITKLK